MTSSVQHRQRYWRRHDNPPLPWWPWGLLPVLGLMVLYLIGAFVIAPTLEEATQAAVSDALARADYPDVTVSTSGQTVTLKAPDSFDQTSLSRAQGMALGSRCHTWAGALNCPTSVRFDNAPEAELVASGDPDSGERTAKVPARYHDVVMTRVNDRVILRGEVPSNERRASLLAAARAQFTQVDDALTVSGEPARQADQFASASALALLLNMNRGQVIWAQGVLGASGLVSAEQEVAVRRNFAELSSTIAIGQLNLRVTKNALACDASFAEALARGTITFDSGAATIDNSSDRLLKRLAQLARQCSGGLTVEGHTDNVGQVAFNNRLSLARAEAVVAALIALNVPAARLTARGYGPSQPVADNSTASGRAQNRRIVIRSTQS